MEGRGQTLGYSLCGFGCWLQMRAGPTEEEEGGGEGGALLYPEEEKV